MTENNVRTRELVLHKRQGIIRDQTYSIRMYKPASLLALLSKAGFSQGSAHTAFFPQEKPGEYGFMEHRMIITAQK